MKASVLTKKIVAGKFRGKTIRLPSKISTRSSKAIVLESFFNTIQFDIVDAVLVELFAGSGSIGLEALSRGAERVIFMEQDRMALRTLRENIGQTDPASCEIVEGDTFANIARVVARLEALQRDAFFYIDPPFSFREGMEDIYDKMIALIAALPVPAVRMIIVEHMTGLELPASVGPYVLRKSKKFGKTSLAYYGVSE